jgi:hypothetical protein
MGKSKDRGRFTGHYILKVRSASLEPLDHPLTLNLPHVILGQVQGMQATCEAQGQS